MSMAVTWHQLHVGLWDMYYTMKGIIQGHLVHRYTPRKATVLCSRIVFWAVLSLDVSTQTVFLYYMSVKYTLKHFFLCFGVHVTPWLVCQTDEINTIFSTLHRLYIWGHRWILVLLLIFIDWYKHSNTKVSGSKCSLDRFWCIIWRPKSVFDQNVHIT